jgi:hypothetical protein
MNRYDELTKNMDITWHHWSRSNFYNFITPTGLKDIIQFVAELEVDTVLDYGCGNNNLHDILSKRFSDKECVGYDPYVPHFSTKPSSKKELTVCYNVLQIVEEQDMDNVITDLHNLTGKYLLINVMIRGRFDRDFSYYNRLFEEKYSNIFLVLEKNRQLTEHKSSWKNLESDQIYLERQFQLETGYFLLKII